jgi:hypothetical protein
VVLAIKISNISVSLGPKVKLAAKSVPGMSAIHSTGFRQANLKRFVFEWKAKRLRKLIMPWINAIQTVGLAARASFPRSVLP